MKQPADESTNTWLSDAAGKKLCDLLASASGADRVKLLGSRKLGGGAIQHNWLLDVSVEGGTTPGRQAFVLRTDAPSSLAIGLSRGDEHRVLQAVFAAGVAAPEPILLHEDTALLGAPFSIMRFCAGEARGHRLVKDTNLDGEALVAQAGVELARLHRIRPPLDDLAFLALPDRSVAELRLAELRGMLDRLAEPQPVFEWGLRWLEMNPPSRGPIVLTHSDFRTGNFLVERNRICAILDWEFARFGDAREDLGWFLAKCWRFGRNDREAGGLGTRNSFLDAYVAESGKRLDRRSIGWFETMATIRWGVIALLQAERHRSGRERSLELALTAHLVPPLELDVIQTIDTLVGRAAA